LPIQCPFDRTWTCVDTYTHARTHAPPPPHTPIHYSYTSCSSAESELGLVLEEFANSDTHTNTQWRLTASNKTDGSYFTSQRQGYDVLTNMPVIPLALIIPWKEVRHLQLLLTFVSALIQIKAICPQAKSEHVFIKVNNYEKDMFYYTPHHRIIGKVLLHYFKLIQKKVNFICEILNCIRIQLRIMLGYSL
jgi:hypothetical protein